MTKQFFHMTLLMGALLAPFLMASPAAAQASTLPVRDQAYLRDLSDLASTLGSAHAVRVACNGRDDQYWRVYMQDFLSLEAPDRGYLRSNLVDAFNNAYSRDSARNISCDAATIAAEKVFAKRGKEISERLAARYFPTRTRRAAPTVTTQPDAPR